ncbi:hypothetical protein HYU50_01905 [Candidatus Woesearchaeota archaeon]|nr:hypothetical protein [Candidatus Woesearchaeota archaeon]
MNKKYRQKIAVMLSILVVMLPIYSSIVFANLSKIEARGKDNVNNYMREEDFITFKATASISGDSAITPNQVLLGSDLQFDSCKAGIDGFDCTLRFPGNGTTVFDARAIPYTVTLKNDAGNVVEAKTDSIFVDNLPPEITSFSVDQALVSSGVVRFSFDVVDHACAASSCSGKCSGISRVELSDSNSNYKDTITLNTDSCTITKVFETSSLEFSEGAHVILAKAFDRFDQLSTASAAFQLDKSAPFIDLNTFKVVDSLDIDLSSFGINPVPVTVKIDIKDTDLNKDNVFANLSELNKNAGLGNAQAACGATENDITTCSWQISLAPDGSGLKKVTILASDSSGNNAKTEITKSFGLDNEGPVVLSLATSQVIDGQSFAKSNNNTFIATFRDEAGVKPTDIKLHADALVKDADSCAQVVDIWQCTWSNINLLNPGKVKVFIDTDSKDRVGNAVSEKFEREVVVDSANPKLIQLVVKGIGGKQETIEDFIIAGDKLQVEAVIEDDSLQKAVADFSRFIFNAQEVDADACTKTGEKTVVCSWTTSSIDIEGFIDDFIRFEFTDIAGNTLEAKEPLKVFGVTGGETPDFWQSAVQCSPSLLDRETMPLINQRAFCLVSLRPKSLVDDLGTFEDVEPVSASLGECNGDLSFVDDIKLENNEFSKEPLIRINFRKQDANIDKLDFLCPIDIISRKGNNIFTVPEKENVDITFQLYNQPLGEVSESVQKKIDDAVEDSNNILKVATFFKKIFFYGQRTCEIGNTIVNVIVLYKVAGKVWANWDAATTGTPANPPAKAQRISWDIITEEARQETLKGWPFFTKACNFVNCKTVIDTGSGALRVDETAITFKFEDPDSLLGKWRQAGNGIIKTLDVEGVVSKYVGGGGKESNPARFMNPKDSIVVASLTACIPGIIYGLDKYRQIQCMYADCLQTGVGEQGLPVFACEDQKGYATCKYVVGEAFKVIPITAAFDYYANLIKSTLANPFKILGAGMAAACNPAIVAEPFSYEICAAVKIASLLGVTIQEVTSIFDSNTWKVQEDFCGRLDKGSSEEKSGGLFGI